MKGAATWVVLAASGRVLKVNSDQLLSLKPATSKATPRAARLLKRRQKTIELPAADQRTVLKLVEALV
jgi:hypothetical protein